MPSCAATRCECGFRRDAETEASRLRQQADQVGSVWLSLPPNERDELLKFRQACIDRGLPLWDLLGAYDNRNFTSPPPLPPTLRNVIKELVTAKDAAGRSKRYNEILRIILDGFAKGRESQWFVLSTLCGLRPEEAEQTTYDAVHIDNGEAHIRVEDQTSTLVTRADAELVLAVDSAGRLTKYRLAILSRRDRKLRVPPDGAPLATRTRPRTSAPDRACRLEEARTTGSISLAGRSSSATR